MINKSCRFKIEKVDVATVLKIINGLKNSTATGVDYVDTRTLKIIADKIAPVLAHIINLSIEFSIFPTMWKWAKVVPLLKSVSMDPIIPKSYRPVALLPIMSKVMEKAVFSQLIKYLEKNGLIHPNLHGSRSGHDTSTALLQLYDKWVEELEEGKTVGVLFCDQSAAFDLCDHNLILQKLEIFGFESSSLEWIKSYLEKRIQSCCVDGELSKPIDLLECGVPQGSVGGPLLWLIFTCDQPDSVHDHMIDGADSHRGCSNPAYQCGDLVGYVDDGAYSFVHKDPEVVSRVLNDKYDSLEEWMAENKLVVNPEKTHFMILGPKKIDRDMFSITAGEYTIKPTESEKLLGCHINQSLKWNDHLVDSKPSMVGQLHVRNNALKRVSFNAAFKTRLMLANGIFHSKLVYLINVWGGAPIYLLKALQVQQMIAARTVCGF